MAQENSSGVQIQTQLLTKCVTLSNLLGFSEPSTSVLWDGILWWSLPHWVVG